MKKYFIVLVAAFLGLMALGVFQASRISQNVHISVDYFVRLCNPAGICSSITKDVTIDNRSIIPICVPNTYFDEYSAADLGVVQNGEISQPLVPMASSFDVDAISLDRAESQSAQYIILPGKKMTVTSHYVDIYNIELNSSVQISSTLRVRPCVGGRGWARDLTAWGKFE